MARIVVLDDNSKICDGIAFLLEHDGHQVRVAQTGSIAIDLAYSFRPELLITDWKIDSEYDGFEVDQAFRFSNPNIKSILITGYPIELAHHPQAEFSKLLMKPFKFSEISKAVVEALAEHSFSCPINAASFQTVP